MSNIGLIINKYPTHIRYLSYALIWMLYLNFMRIFSPLGVDWLDWHGDRIFNFVEFLRLNGYFSFYGFSIWTQCIDCDLSSNSRVNEIYLSHSSLSYLPYITINHFFGKETLLLYGPMLDKVIIFLAAAFCSELALSVLQKKSKLPLYAVSILGFSFFALNPWTYKMLLASWNDIYFLMFFLLGLLAFTKDQQTLGLSSFFLASIFHYQWGLIIGAFYLSIYIANSILSSREDINKCFPCASNNSAFNFKIILSLLMPALAIILIRLIASSQIEATTGSSLLYRIGISGDDIHNGALFGALQFLGGNRITNCLNGLDLTLLSSSMHMKIMLFNCILSIATMLAISVSSIAGIFLALRKVPASMRVILPLLFSLIVMICILQQSLSAHLMGYSYIFSALFSLGLVAIFSFAFTSIQSRLLRVIFTAPLAIGIIITCIRVSMLTGLNG